jgi:hypothetical protein
MGIRIKLVNRESGALRKRLREISSAIDPRSPRMDRFRYRISKIRKEDNENMLYRARSEMAGEDRFGKPLAKPAKSTVAHYNRKGLIRQVLAPHGLNSRAITRFFTSWSLNGRVWRMVDGWRNIPWMIYHLQGCEKGSNEKRPKWSLPQRDIGGWSLKGLAVARREFAAFSKRVFTGR